MLRSAAYPSSLVHVLAGAVSLALTSACLVAPLHAAEPASGTAASSPPAAASSATGGATAPTLSGIVAELGRIESLQRQVATTLQETAGWNAVADKLADSALAADLQALEQGRDTLSRVRYVELIDADTRLRERAQAATDATEVLGSLSRKVEEDLDRLDREAARWPQRAAAARAHEAPAEVQRRADSAAPLLAGLRDRLRARRDELLVAYAQGVELRARIDAVRATVAERRERIRTELSRIADVPIWEDHTLALPHDEVVVGLRLARLELVDYLRHHGGPLALLFGAAVAAMFLLIRQPLSAGPPGAAPAQPAAGLALAAAVLASAVLAVVLAPRAPFILYRLVGLVVPLLAGFVATRTFAAPIAPTAWALVLAVFVNGSRLLAGMSPVAERLVLAIQVLPFAIALAYDWRRGALARFLSGWSAGAVRRLAQAALLAVAVIVVASVVGYANVAHAIAIVLVVAPGFALLAGALAWALDRACAGLLALPLAQSLRSVRERKEAILRTLHRIVVAFCWGFGILAFAIAHSALDGLLRAGMLVANASVSVGDVTIAASAIFLAVLVVAVTWLLTKLVRFVLDHEVLPRFNLRSGVPIAISTIVGYLLVVGGFVLAMAALGIDLTKVTLLAGALGVGVGLGLQGVVSNFVSGLILMVERPINVGDQVDVGGVLGEVRRIGVRSSTIRTVQGAEVIVPNSDLASKQVTNWTLSDRARRYEVDVGVAYGSDPAEVLRLLENAVANVPEVQKVPPPRALFVGFGESSLDFRLFAWVESVDIGLQAQNSMRTAVLEALERSGIEIPYPQRVMNVRYAPSATDRPAPPGLPA